MLCTEKIQNKTESIDNFILLTRDTTFKYFLKHEELKKYFQQIIYKKTKYNLSDYTLIDNEENSGNKRKDYKMDLVFQKDNHVIILEMESEKSESSRIKDYQYLYRKAGKRFDRGENYTPTYTTLIIFNNFRHESIHNLEMSHFTFKDEHSNSVIQDIESFEIYLPTFDRKCYDKYEEVDKRLVLFNCTSFEEMRGLNTSPIDLKIIEELERLSMDMDFRDDYDYENVQRKLRNSAKIEGYQEGFNLGMEAGMKTGIENGMETGIETGMRDSKIQIAKNMLVKKININTISECTGLAIQEIENLK